MLATQIRQSETPSDKITGGRHEGGERERGEGQGALVTAKRKAINRRCVN